MKHFMLLAFIAVPLCAMEESVSVPVEQGDQSLSAHHILKHSNLTDARGNKIKALATAIEQMKAHKKLLKKNPSATAKPELRDFMTSYKKFKTAIGNDINAAASASKAVGELPGPVSNLEGLASTLINDALALVNSSSLTDAQKQKWQKWLGFASAAVGTAVGASFFVAWMYNAFECKPSVFCNTTGM